VWHSRFEIQVLADVTVRHGFPGEWGSARGGENSVQRIFLVELTDCVAVCRVGKDVPGVVRREVFECDGIFERDVVGE
jgi:hypothetical protein